MAIPLGTDQFNMPPIPPWISQPARRLLWTLQGPSSNALFVLGKDENPDGPCEPYCSQTHAGTSWHPIAQEPMTEISIASLTVMKENLDCWEGVWWDLNMEGYDEDVQPDPSDFPPTFTPLVVRASSREFITVHE